MFSLPGQLRMCVLGRSCPQGSLRGKTRRRSQRKHSMGGKLTVLIAVVNRPRAATASCAGISDRYYDSPRFPAILSDDVSLRRISCPIVFLCPANDDHGCISELDLTVLRQAKWRDHLPADSRPDVSRKAGGRFLQPAWRQAGNNGGSRKHDVSVVPPFQGN